MRTVFKIGLFALFILNFVNAHAQQFDWVTGGGTTANDATLFDNPEATDFICTDHNGNVYTISVIGNGSIYADTFYSQGSSVNDQNFMVASYTCTGQMRWAKLITSTSNYILACGITADSLGHIYVAGHFSNATLYIGNDTSITGIYDETNGLIQFDTSGHFNWIKYVGDNTFNTISGTFGIGAVIAMDGSNNVHFINYLRSGVNIMPGVVSQFGSYDLTYNVSGTLLGAVRLNMDSIWYLNAATIDPVTNKLYVCGARTLQYVDTFASYAAAFDANRNLLWMDTIGHDAGGFGSVIYDKIGHLYFGGDANDSFSFNGYFLPAGAKSLIVKTDTLGKPMWIQQYLIAGSDVSVIEAITLLPNNLIAATGFFVGTLTIPNSPISIITTPGEIQNPFLTLLDTSGIVMSLLQIHGDGEYDWGKSITSDRVGNIYIGGQVADSIHAGGIPAYHSVGGNTDFFVMKYGVDCDCTSMPVANYTDTGAHYIKGFTYNGTTTGVDSVVWNFGDGSATVNSMSHQTHTYDTGTYEVCVYAYTACGCDMHCSRVVVTPPQSVGITSIENIGVSVYPNPAKDELNITTQSSGISYRLFSITGAFLQSGSLQQGNNDVSLNGFATGMYILETKDNNGLVKVVRVVKE